MKTYQDLKNLLVFDIETVKLTKTFSGLSEGMQKAWKKTCDKPSVTDNGGPATFEQLYTTKAALFAEFSKVISISYGVFTETADRNLQLTVSEISGHDEVEILTKFNEVVNKIGYNLVMVGHNIKFFDMPFLCKRFLINGLLIPQHMDIRGKKPWEIKHLDTAEIWNFGNLKGSMPLSTITTVLGIPSSKDDIDGSMVDSTYYNEENGLARITLYCCKDVVATAQAYLRMNSTPVIPDENVTMPEIDLVALDPEMFFKQGNSYMKKVIDFEKEKLENIDFKNKKQTSTTTVTPDKNEDTGLNVKDYVSPYGSKMEPVIKDPLFSDAKIESK
jgi:DNA polymerase elongation subunit (family B)